MSLALSKSGAIAGTSPLSRLRPALVAAVFVVISCVLALAQSTGTTVTLAWNPVASSATAGYRLYQGAASRSYTNLFDAGNQTNATISGLAAGCTYYFAVTDYTTNGLESDYSIELSYTVPLATNVAPTVVLTAPANGTVYSAPAGIGLAASVVTNGHTIAKVQFYSGSALLGEDALPPYVFSWTSVPAGNYTLSAQVVYDSGSVATSPSISVTVAAPPTAGTTFAASSGSISGFVVTNGMIFQTTTTGVTNGGRAAYTFTVGASGDYLVSGLVDATNANANSFYVNIDAEPSDPTMIWDIPVIATFTNQTVSWRGNGTATTDQFTPKVFNLAQGTHQLIVRGRAAYAQLASLTIVPATVLPNPWQALDIGSPLLTGSASISGSQYTVAGAGALSGSADQLRFLYQSMSGNGEIRARLSSLQGLNADGRGGVLMREALTPGARYAFMGLSGDGTVYWQRRASTSGSTTSNTSGSGTASNFWARVVRSGNKFYGYKSADGINWTRVASASIGMATNIYFGFAVASGSSNTVGTAVFDNANVIP